MKRFKFNLIELLVLIVMISIMPMFAQAASNVFYNCTLSTGQCDLGGASWAVAKTPNINLNTVNVKQIWIHNMNSTSTITVEVYKNGISTGAASLVLRYVVPGTPGTYPVFDHELSSTLTNADLYNIPKLAIGYVNDATTANLYTLKATIKYSIP